MECFFDLVLVDPSCQPPDLTIPLIISRRRRWIGGSVFQILLYIKHSLIPIQIQPSDLKKKWVVDVSVREQTDFDYLIFSTKNLRSFSKSSRRFRFSKKAEVTENEQISYGYK